MRTDILNTLHTLLTIAGCLFVAITVFVFATWEDHTDEIRELTREIRRDAR